MTDPGGKELPPIDFATYVLSLAQVAHLHLGDGSADEQNLPMAKHDIDLLTLLQEKTRGNLTGEEERILEQALYDLRMRYVELKTNK